MTLALLLTAVTGAWATEPRVINSEISHESLKVGDILVEGFSISGPYSTMFYFNAGRAKKGETLLTEDVKFYKGDITSVGTNAVITLYDGAYFDAAGTYTPIDENGQVANAWIVTSTNESGNSDFHLSGYKYVAPTDEPTIDVTTDAASEQDLFTEASFEMPTGDVTVNYMLVRDMQDETNPVAFTGLPTTTTDPIIVKKGDNGKYQPIKTLTIQLIDPLAAAEAQNIIDADGITVKVLVGNGGTPIEYDQENPITREDFLADVKPGYYWIKAEPTDENSPYDGTVYSSEFTVVEQYDLTVKPANDFSKGKIESVTVGTESITIDANTGEATKTGIAPDTEVKIKAKRGYVIDKVEAKKTMKLLTLTVNGVTIYYAEGDSWANAISRDENKDSGLFIREGNRVHHTNYGQLVDSNTEAVLPVAIINANESYRFIK